jgi:hypothetical protein
MGRRRIVVMRVGMGVELGLASPWERSLGLLPIMGGVRPAIAITRIVARQQPNVDLTKVDQHTSQ